MGSGVGWDGGVYYIKKVIFIIHMGKISVVSAFLFFSKMDFCGFVQRCKICKLDPTNLLVF